jgi:hypothetical protein
MLLVRADVHGSTYWLRDEHTRQQLARLEWHPCKLVAMPACAIMSSIGSGIHSLVTH